MEISKETHKRLHNLFPKSIWTVVHLTEGEAEVLLEILHQIFDDEYEGILTASGERVRIAAVIEKLEQQVEWV